MPDRDGSGMNPPGTRRNGEATLQSLGQVTGELLHDLVGLVGILSSRVALVREDSRVGRPVTEEINRIAKDCDYLKVMIQDILDEIRGGQRSPEISFPVRHALQEVVDRWLASAPSVTTRLTCTASQEVQVAGPKSFFARAMTNLLQNAARHARTEIRLSIDPEVRWGRRGVLIAIEDDGEGIDSALGERVFEPLARGETGGTGLGLSFSRWAVQQLGGAIIHRQGSELGGACFEIWMPITGKDGVERGTVANVSGDRLAGRRILIIDDEPMIRRMYRRLLEKAGAEVEEVVPGTGTTCAELADEIAAIDPDVILLDLNLSGWSGIEVWDSLAERHPSRSRRVLFLSGDIWSGETLGAKYPPMLSKLVEWAELVERIGEVADHEEAPRGSG